MNTNRLLSRKTLIKIIGFSSATAILMKLAMTNFRLYAKDASKEVASTNQLVKPANYFTTTTTTTTKDESNNEKLVGVQLITRHGARTPLHLIPSIEEATYTPDMLTPYVNAKVSYKSIGKSKITSEYSLYDKYNFKKKLKGGAPSGQLTTVGEKQMFDLGRELREKYVKKLKFLKPEYDRSEVYSRSSHFERTINSAKCVLVGLFTEPEDSKIDFLIHVHENEDEWIFPNALNCKYFSHLHRNTFKLLARKEYTELLEKINELNDHLGNEKGNKVSYTVFRDDLIARKAHNIPIPKELEKFLHKVDELAGLEMASIFEHNIKLSCGLFISLMMNNIQKFIKNNENIEKHQKFMYYSAHDSSIMSLLVALSRGSSVQMDYTWPPFGAYISIELWQRENDKNEKSQTNSDKYFIRVNYMDKPIVLDKCNKGEKDKTICKFDDFLNLLNESSIDEKTYREQCDQSFDEHTLTK